MRPVVYRPNDEVHRAIGRCIGAPGSPGGCDHVGIPGTFPPLCRSHGGAAPLSAAAAKLRMEAVRSRLQTELEPAIITCVKKLMSIVQTEGPFLEGTVVETEQLSQRGDVVQVRDGVRIRTSDVIKAIDRLLSLAGVTPEVTSLTVSIAQGPADEGTSPTATADPVAQLRAMLEAAPDDRLARLAERLNPALVAGGSIETTGSE